MQVIVVEKGNVHTEGRPCIVLTSFKEDGAHYGNLVAQEDRAALQALADQGRISSKQHSIYYLPTPARPYSGVLVLGLGEKDRFGAEVLRRAAGKAAPATTPREPSPSPLQGCMPGSIPPYSRLEPEIRGAPLRGLEARAVQYHHLFLGP